LFAHRRKGEKWFRQVPENIATRKNFYSILREDGKFDDRVEHMLAKGIEAPGLAALWRLKKGGIIPSWDTRESVATFLAVQYTRVPEIRDNMHRLLGIVANAFTDEVLEDENLMVERLPQTESIDRTKAERAARQLKRLVKAGHIRPVVKQEASMKMLFMAVEDSASGFMEMDWLVLVAPEASFFTSDIPVYVSPEAIARQFIGIATEGNVMNVPLSSRPLSSDGETRRSPHQVADAEGDCASRFRRRTRKATPCREICASDTGYDSKAQRSNRYLLG
jgi:hypothetical protein